jgi:hypothetical protein
MTKTGFWYVDFTLSLDGEAVTFDRLSEETQKHITEQILDGYVGGEICEEIDVQRG